MFVCTLCSKQSSRQIPLSSPKDLPCAVFLFRATEGLQANWSSKTIGPRDCLIMMAHFITHLGTQEESTIDKAPQQWNSIILLFCEAALVTTTLAVLTLLWWRSAEAARVRKTKTSRGGSQVLPSPVPVLPRWLGFLGGHTLLINISKVIRYEKSNNILLLLYIQLFSRRVP